MRRNQQRFLWLGSSILGVLTLSPALLGQASPDSRAAGPVPTDWSHHHVIFSRPATAEQAGRVQRDPRYWQQLRRQSLAKLPEAGGSLAPELQLGSNASLPGNNQGLNRDWSENLGSGATVGAGNFPAKFAFSSTEFSCANDYVVYSTGLFGETGQASIVAYNNLYSGCGGTVPSVYWAYDTGSAIKTSPAFSEDGNQVAFVHGGGASGAILTLLKWAPSTTESVSSPMVLTPVLNHLYPACPAPCTTQRTLRNSGGTPDEDTHSSLFYDFSSDTAYVGDDSGYLHKFTPVFKGILNEVKTGGWPKVVNPATPTPLTSPVYDFGSGNVFVADTGGFLYQVSASTPPTVTISGQLDFSTELDGGPGIVEGPIVDSTGGFVYVFATSDGSVGCSGGAACTAVYQLSTGFISPNTGSEAVVGNSSVELTVPSPLYIGAFDSTYENSVNATGHLYVCGNTGGSPTIYQVPIQGGVMGTPLAGPVLSTASTPCSPVTDILNPNVPGGATEWIFASAETGGTSAACDSGGCILNFKDTPWLPLTAYTVGQEVLDSSLNIEVVSVAGTSGSTVSWNGSLGGTTTDGTVNWLDQGPASAVTPAAWIADHAYATPSTILDGNGNIELVTSAGTSGATVTFNTTPGGTTTDGTLTWTNVGAIATAAMPAAGGTSGIIMDNTVGPGTLAGASEVYFTTLSGGCGGTDDVDGCAVQASQSVLQ